MLSRNFGRIWTGRANWQDAAATMTRQERLTLVHLLLDLDQPVKGDEIADAWDSEIRARVEAVNEGRVSGTPYDQIKKEISDRLSSR
jgi:putative addiction module component (TIGR02574 family)